jgi:hypothetical protein
MKVELNSIYGQVYITPVIKITHNKSLNGRHELIFGWLKWELTIIK